MENASKALLMAGSVLLSILIISALVLMYTSITELKQTEASSDEEQKLAEYNRKIENFDKNVLYGSEILSLANLIDDYNATQSELKGYTKINFTFTVKNGGDNIKGTYTNCSKLTEAYKALEKEVNNWELGDNDNIPNNNNPYKIILESVLKKTGRRETIEFTETAKELSGTINSKLKELLANKYKVKEEELDNVIQKLRNKTTKYTDLKSEITTFKNTKYSDIVFTYDEHTSRVIGIKIK